MVEKKVVIVIVEGPSDENAIGGILKEFFSASEVQFVVVHGDITSDEATTIDNAVKRINRLVTEIRQKYGYLQRDIEKIIHIADTDGTFTKRCVVKAKTDTILYYEDHIESDNIAATEKRNRHKAEIMRKLYMTTKVNKCKYMLYFNSCNLEHVLYNELREFSNAEKEFLSDQFAERFEGKHEEFIDFINDPAVAVSGTYKETWKYIEKEKHSLERHSNMHLIFEIE